MRVRMDACLGQNDALNVKRVVVGTIEFDEVHFAEHYASEDSVVEGLDAGVYGQDYSQFLVVLKKPVLGWEAFRIQGFAAGDSSYVVAGDPRNGLTLMVGKLTVGDSLAEWYGACEFGYRQVHNDFQIGSADISADYCLYEDLTGGSRGYGLKVIVRDLNQKIPEPQRSAGVTLEGSEAHEAFSTWTGHHGCWQHFRIATEYATYESLNKSLYEDNTEERTVKYGEDPPTVESIPIPNFPGPC